LLIKIFQTILLIVLFSKKTCYSVWGAWAWGGKHRVAGYKGRLKI